jgi:hypothetical protein
MAIFLCCISDSFLVENNFVIFNFNSFQSTSVKRFFTVNFAQLTLPREQTTKVIS